MAATNSLVISFGIVIILLLPTAPYGLKQKRIVTRLIHHQAYDSPYFNSRSSINELAEMDLEISINRINHLGGQTSKTMEKEDYTNENHQKNGSIQAVILTRLVSPLFLVLLQIGTPPSYQALAMDTASTLLWVKCGIAEDPGAIQLFKIYDPHKSSTYSKYVRCDKFCVGDIHCNDRCEYRVSYKNSEYMRGGFGLESGEYIRGEFGSERFLFPSPMSNGTMLDDIIFGCSKEADISLVNGMLGLNTGRVSLVSQLGLTKFSYCISNLSAPYYQSNTLILGQNYEIGGLPTPLIVEGSKYYVNIERISFAGQRLDIDKQKLRRLSGRGGALFDTGTSLTLLQRIAYTKLEEATINFIGDTLKRVDVTHQQQIHRTCFVGDLQSDFANFPMVTLHFEGGAQMQLDKENIFKQMTNQLVCLNVVAAEDFPYNPYSIIGVNAQQYFYIAFDLAKQELRFRRIRNMGCEFLWGEGDD